MHMNVSMSFYLTLHQAKSSHVLIGPFSEQSLVSGECGGITTARWRNKGGKIVTRATIFLGLFKR